MLFLFEILDAAALKLQDAKISFAVAGGLAANLYRQVRNRESVYATSGLSGQRE